MSECTVATPPELEPHAVVFSVVHCPTGRVFRCEMSSFDAVVVTSMPLGLSPWADGELRAAVVEAAQAHAAANRETFAPWFERISVSSGWSPPAAPPRIPLSK